MERFGAFLGPLGKSLGKQVQAGDEEEDELVFPGDFLGEGIDADVSGGSFFRPFVPHPDVGKAVSEEWVQFEVTADQALETVAQVAVVKFLVAELCKDVVDGFH